VPLTKKLQNTHIFFTPHILGGYGWLFPKGKAANVGICIDLSVDKKLLALEKFAFSLIKKGLITKEILSETSGLIPVSGFKKVRHGNINLLGDAASLTDPMTGAGILNALKSGELAGASALKAIENNDLELLSEFENNCKNSFLPSLTRAHNKRKFLQEFWNSGIDGLSSAIKKSWPAFPEYYRD